MTRINKRKLKKDRIGYALILISLIVICISFFAYSKIKQSYIVLDKLTLCPENGPHSYTVVLLDATDSFNSIQQAVIRRQLEEIKLEIPRYGSIELYAVRAIDTQLLNPEIKICNPGTKENINPIIGNPEKIQKRWVNDFSNKLDDIFNRILNLEPANDSPIMQSIQSVNISAFPLKELPEKQKRLIIVSDMLQHTSEYSHYSSDINFSQFQNTEYFKKIKTNLRNTTIEILYVRRDINRNLQNRKHIQFWQDYFNALNGELTKVIAIEG